MNEQSTSVSLQPNELRIGNYLKTVEFSSEYFEVRAISKDRVLPLTLVDKDGYSFDWALSEAMPIPLTPEWLEKFGFEKESKASYSTGEELWYSVYTKGAFTYNSIQDAWWYHGVLEVQPMYVHTFQNLYYALTSTELKTK